jgi:outer membrane receptor protein involved in Fe transport
MMIADWSWWSRLMVSCVVVMTAASTVRADAGQVAAPPAAATNPSTGNASTFATPTGTDESTATTQVASFATTRLKDSPAVVTVISGEDIKAVGARDLIDILYLVPGYFFGVDTDGVVGPGFRGLWGHEGKILLMIDGKEMNELLFSNMQLGNEFPVELIERVEVVRGPGSVIYGGNAELSVINVVTRGLQGSTDLMLTATYGEMTGARAVSTGYGRRKVTASGRYVSDRIPGLSAFASASVGQGQRSVQNFVDYSGTAATMEGQSALNPAVVQAGVGYKDVQASFLYHHLGMTSISGSGTTLPAPLPVNFDALHGELVGTFRVNDRLEIVPRFNVTYQRPWHIPDGSSLYDKSVRRLRGRLLGRWAPLDELQVTVGGDASFDEAKLLTPAAMMFPFQTPFNLTNNSVAYQTIGGFMELYSENPIVNISAGARYDHLSTIGGALVPRLVLLRTFGALSLKGLFSLSFRAPSIENINAGRNVTPEHTRVFEFEGAVDLPFQQKLSANVYDVAIDSPIAYTHDPVTMGDGYLNLGRQGTRGVEVSYRLRSRWARVEANYSFYRPSFSNNIAPYLVPGHSDQFLGAPAHGGSVRGTFRLWSLFATPSVIFVGPRFARAAPDASGAETAMTMPGEVLANLFIHRDNVGVRGLTVGLGIYNIFGANFRFVHASAASTFQNDHAPLPGLDREVMLRVSYLFEPFEGAASGAPPR